MSVAKSLVANLTVFEDNVFLCYTVFSRFIRRGRAEPFLRQNERNERNINRNSESIRFDDRVGDNDNNNRVRSEVNGEHLLV